VDVDLDEKFHGRERSNRFARPSATALAELDRKGN
jgi:hypothetical protein